MSKNGIFLVFLAVFASACQQAQDEPSSQVVEEKDPVESTPSVDAAVNRANEAIRALQSGLVEALTSEMKKGGPPSAVHVCRDEAQVITAKVAQEEGVDVGRTSHRLRNPKNAPRPWAEAFVSEAAGKKTSEVEAQVVDLGDKMGVLKPINTLGLCTNCHGKAEEIAPEVRQALAEGYPEDEAVGFSVGDLRGWMWAEVPKQKAEN
jgi:hypothetical protein